MDYHPAGALRPSRAGRFSAVVARAAEENLISWETAADYLEVPAERLRNALPDVRDLYPSVF